MRTESSRAQISEQTLKCEVFLQQHYPEAASLSSLVKLLLSTAFFHTKTVFIGSVCPQNSDVLCSDVMAKGHGQVDAPLVTFCTFNIKGKEE